MSGNTRTDRIRGLMLKPVDMPTPALVVLLTVAGLAQVWYNSRFGGMLVMSGVILGYVVPSKTGGQGFWSFKTHTVLGVPLLVALGAVIGVVITLVAFIVQLALLIVFGLLLLWVVIKAWRNKDVLMQALGGLRSFGQ